MKHLFYCLFLMLLCVGCKGEDDPITEEKHDSLSATTRMGGSIDLTLSGSTVLISWTRSFGYNVGISVEVFIEANGIKTVVGTYSSDEDSGSGSFSVSSGIPNLNYIPNSVSLKARVRDLPRYGLSRESVIVSVHNTNSSDPNNPEAIVCNHPSISGTQSLTIMVDKNLGYIDFYRGKDGTGLFAFKFSIGTRIGYDPVTHDPLFSGEKSVQIARFYPWATPGTDPLLHFYLSNMEKFVGDPNAIASLEVRIYDISCQKLAPANDFPQCTNYYKYEFSNVPLGYINQYQSVTMNAVKETRPRSGSY